MLIDRKHIPWSVVTALLALVCVGLYALDAPRRADSVSRYGSSPLGLTLGIAALATMLLLVMLSLKRKAPTLRIGRAQTWLRAHIWLGALLPLLVALHAGFRSGGQLTVGLWVLLGIVTVSGLLGLLLQQLVPRLLLHSVPGETIWQQHARELQSLTQQATQIVTTYAGSLDQPAPPFVPALPSPSSTAAPNSPEPATPAPVSVAKPPAGGEPLRQFYLNRVGPFLAGTDHALGRIDQMDALFHAAQLQTPEHIHPGLVALRELCDRRLQLLRQQLLMRALLGWLIVHVPLSWALLALSVVHAVVALRYR